MPGEVVIHCEVDLGELSRDLRAMGKDLDRPLRDALRDGASMVVDTAKVLMRERPEGAWRGSSGAEYGHIRSYYEARVATLSSSVVSDHPAAEVWEWGGTIHPLLGEAHFALSKSTIKEQLRLKLVAQDKDRPPWTFHIPREQPVGRAAEARMPEIERNLDTAVDALIRRYGF
jgi:hypothetical protein